MGFGLSTWVWRCTHVCCVSLRALKAPPAGWQEAELQWFWWSWGDVHTPGICLSVSFILICSWGTFLTKHKNSGVLAGLYRFGVVQCCIIMPWINVFNRSSYGSNGKSQNLAAAPDLLKDLNFKEHEGFNPTLSTLDQVASNRSDCILSMNRFTLNSFSSYHKASFFLVCNW